MIHTGQGSGFTSLLPPFTSTTTRSSSSGGGGLATLLDPGAGSGAFARSGGRFGRSRGGGFVVGAADGGVGLGDFAEFFQLLLDGAGGAGGCVGGELEEALGVRGKRVWKGEGGEEGLACLATASKSGFTSVAWRIARRSLVLASPGMDVRG